ncbi:hypothetical protein [Arthrobacter sp. Z1-15]
MNDCTTTVCRNETSTYLCNQCVSDLQLWLDKVTETRQMLFTTMAKLDNTGPKNSEGGGGGSTGSAMPLRDGAMDKRHALAMWEGLKAAELANDEYAGGFLSMLRELIQDAEKLVDLPPETWAYGTCGATLGEITCDAPLTEEAGVATVKCDTCGTLHDVTARRLKMAEEAKGEPLPPKEVINYLRVQTQTPIKLFDFKNWVKRGRLKYVLDRVTIDDKARRVYHPGEVFRVAQEMRDKHVKS